MVPVLMSVQIKGAGQSVALHWPAASGLLSAHGFVGGLHVHGGIRVLSKWQSAPLGQVPAHCAAVEPLHGLSSLDAGTHTSDTTNFFWLRLPNWSKTTWLVEAGSGLAMVG